MVRKFIIIFSKYPYINFSRKVVELFTGIVILDSVNTGINTEDKKNLIL